MVHWCELGLGLLQQLADLVSGGNLGDLLAWCDTNVSMTDHFIHALDSELLCSFALFVGHQPSWERLALLLAWRRLYILQALVGVVPSEGFQTLDGILRVAAPDESILKDGDAPPKKHGMVDGNSHLDSCPASVGRDARSLLEGVDYDTVTSYCFQKSWRDSKKQCWWPSSKGTLKQAFRLHPVEAASGLTHQTQDGLEMYVRSSTCVAVGEIGLDYTRVGSANGRDLQRKVFDRLCRFANEVGKPVVIYCRGVPASGVFSDCLTILTQNLSRAHRVYWHHFSGNVAVAREIENAFPSIVFGVAPGVLKEQYDDVLEDFIMPTAPERLLVESVAPAIIRGYLPSWQGWHQ